MAGVRRDQDFAAWQLADAFKREVFRLVRQSVDASRDFKYRDQLRDAAGGITKHITEGYLRFSPLDFAHFLDYALGSTGEAERRLRDGIELGYFPEPDCREAFRFAKRCFVATLRLKQSQLRYAEQQRLQKRRQPALRPQRPRQTGRTQRPPFRKKHDSDEPTSP
jgi:four helix bundle protein